MTSASMAGTQAVARSAALLREVAASQGGQATLATLAQHLELERPTAHRILQRLVTERLLVQDPVSRCYELGPLLYELGLAAHPPHSWHAQASTETLRLAKETGDTVFAITQSGLDSLCIDRQEGDYPVKALLMNPGRRRPMGTGAGSVALLTAMPADKAEHILQANAHRLLSSGESHVQEILNDVERGRHMGYVVRVPNDAPEILSLAVPVLNRYRTPILSLSISAQQFRIEKRLEVLLQQLQQSKQALENRLLSD